MAASAAKAPVWHDGLKFDRQSRASEKHPSQLVDLFTHCVSALQKNSLQECRNNFFSVGRLMNDGFSVLPSHFEALKILSCVDF